MRRARRNSLFALSLLWPLAVAAQETGPAGPEPEAATRRQAEEAERIRALHDDAQREATERAAQALAEEKRLSAAQAEAFERLKKAETAARDLKALMTDLDNRRIEARKAVEADAAVLARVIPVAVRLSLYPEARLLGSGQPPEETLRGLAIMRQIARQADARAKDLADNRDTLDMLEADAARTAPLLASAESARAREAEALAQDLDEARTRRRVAEQAAEDAARRAAAEAARANSLRSMLRVLETQRRLAETRAAEDGQRAARDQKADAVEAARLRQAALARPAGNGALTAAARPSGQLAPPVPGTLLRGWGDPDNGETATGQSWQTDPGAGVVAPCAGTVAFAEPFRGYGPLVIVDCGGGYHAVMSGMDKIAVVPGQSVRDGDPVGGMKAATKLAQSSADGTEDPAPVRPVLYFELRKGGRPTNPAPWLRSP